MKLKRLIKSKIFKWGLLATATISVGAIATSLALNINSANNFNPNYLNESKRAIANQNYRLVSNSVINLDQKFKDLYINLLGSNLEQNAAFLNAIKTALKISSYWENNNVPDQSKLDFKVTSVIDSLAVNSSSETQYYPAINVVPILDGIELDPATVSIIGTNLGDGKTHAFDTIRNNSDNTNNIASFRYIPSNFSFIPSPVVMAKSGSINNLATSSLEPLNGVQLKQHLLSNVDLLNTIFNNLPELSNTNESITSNGQFKLGNDGINIGNYSSRRNEGDYVVCTYPVSLDLQFILKDTIAVPSTLINTDFSIEVYYPDKFINPPSSYDSNLVETAISNVLTFSKLAGVQNLSPYDLDIIRQNDPSTFLNTYIIPLIKASSTNLPENLLASDLDIIPVGSNYINASNGTIRYQITIKKVKVGGVISTDRAHWIEDNFVISGLLKSHETEYTKTYSVAGNDILREKLPSDYYGTYDRLLEELARTNSVISNVKPSFVTNGSIYSDTNAGAGNQIASLFGASVAYYDLSNSVFDNKSGSITDIRVQLRGYYDANGKINNSQPKSFSINLVGFKKDNNQSLTSVNEIDISNKWSTYPAQIFLIPKASRPVDNAPYDGNLPVVPEYQISDELERVSGDEIKQYILENTNGLPDNAKDISQYKLRDLKINNFGLAQAETGSITGRVYFPYYYDFSDGNYIVVQNPDPGPTNSNTSTRWFNFTISGFSRVPGQTNIVSQYRTKNIVIKNEYGVYEEQPASSIALTDYKNMLEADVNLKKQLIKQWLVDNKKIVSNPWSTFDQNMLNETVGIRDIVINDEEKDNNVLKVSFKFNYFNGAGVFVQDADNQYTSTIIISNFKSTEPIKKNSVIIDGSTISLNSFSYPINLYTQEEFVKNLNGPDTSPIHQQLSELISTYSVADIDLSNKPSYYIDLTPENGPDGQPVFPIDKNKPGSVFVRIAFKNNIWINGQFHKGTIPRPAPGSTDWKIIEINNFSIVSDTSIPSTIQVTNELSGNTAAGAAASSSFINNQIKPLIINSIYNPQATEFFPDPNNPSGPPIRNPNYVNTSDIPLYENDGMIVAGNGKSYFGEVNDFDGTITLKFKFKGGTWFKDNILQPNDSEPITVKLTGFKPIVKDPRVWYNTSINIDTTGLSANQNNGYNELASNLAPNSSVTGNTTGNPSVQVVEETIKRIKQVLIRPSSDGSNGNDIDIEFLPVTMLVERNTYNNKNGTLITNLSTYGTNVYDPKTGLIYDDPNHPFVFEVYVSGFDKTRVTTNVSNITINDKSDITPPTNINEVLNNLKAKINLNNLFSNSLPKAFTKSDADTAINVNNYLYIPTTINGNEPNITANYTTGAIEIKKMALMYYIDKDNNLVYGNKTYNTNVIKSQKITWEQIETNPDSWANTNHALIINNVSISGYKQMAPTTINDRVSLNNYDYASMLPSDFIEFVRNKTDISGTTASSTLGEKIGKLLIYIPQFNDYGQTNPDYVNNLNYYFTNYNSDINGYPVEYTIDDNSIKPDNIKGTLTFKLTLTNNYFYEADDKTIVFRNKNNPIDPTTPVSQTITVQGFNSVKETTFNSRVNIYDVRSSTNNPTLDKNRTDLFWYNIKSSDGSYNDTKTKLKDIIKDNIRLFINNPYNLTAEEIDKYIKIDGLTEASSDFKSGVLKFRVQLYKYINSVGEIIDAPISSDPGVVPSAEPLNATVEIYGFNSYGATKGNDLINSATLNINVQSYPFLKTLDFFATNATVESAFAQSPVNNEGQAQIILDNMSNVPPSSIFQYSELDPNTNQRVLKDVSIQLQTPVNPDKNDPKRTGTITFNNILIERGSSVIIGQTVFSLNLYGFDKIIQTVPKSDTWDISLDYNKIAKEFDNINVSQRSLQDFLNKTIVYYNGADVPLFNVFISNAVYNKNNNPDNPNTELIVNTIIKNTPAQGTILIEYSFKNYYDANGIKQNSVSQKYRAIIAGLKIHQATTPVTSDSIRSTVPINILPSTLLEATNDPSVPNNPMTELINILNLPGNISQLFTNISNDASVDKFRITNAQIINVNDQTGSIGVKLYAVNYLNEDGRPDSNERLFENIFNIIGLNFIKPTEINATSISINKLFEGKRMPAFPPNITNFTPLQYVGYINAELLSAKSDNKTDEEVLKIFNDYLIELINPLYNPPEGYVSDLYPTPVPPEPPTEGPGETPNPVPPEPPTEGPGETPEPPPPEASFKLPMTSRAVLAFQKYTSAIGTNLFSSNIVLPGCEYAIDSQGNYNVKVDSVQTLDSLWTAFDYNNKVSGDGLQTFEVANSLVPDDRLGTISIKMKVKGIWTFKTQTSLHPNTDIKNVIADKTNGSSATETRFIPLNLTITGFKKNSTTQETLSNAIIIGSSVGGALVIILIIVIAAFMIKKFSSK